MSGDGFHTTTIASYPVPRLSQCGPFRAEMSNKEASVAVVGGGLVGSLQGILLSQSGYQVDLYEARPDIRTQEHVSGRSINLALSVRGREALRAVGLEDTVLETAIPMHARMIHALSGETSAQPYGRKDQCIYSVDRRKLNELLLSVAESKPNLSLHFEHKLARASLDDKTLVFQVGEKDKQEKTVETDFIFGCDGAHSTVRRQMMRWGRLNYSQEYIEHGYKELTLPPTSEGDFAIPPNYLHIWPRNEFMMIALPNQDCSFTMTLFMPFKVFDSIETEEDLLAFFTKHFPDSMDKIGVARLVRDYFQNPVGGLISVKCYPHYMAGSIVILGDAAHAIVPFYGQGMNAGFEDCLIFYELLEKLKSIKAAAVRYSIAHWRDTHAIADLSMSNYIEMRAHVNSRVFLLRKSLDNLLHAVFPRTFIPLYSMVAFSRIPYHQVVERNRRQRHRVNKALVLLGVTALGFAGYLFYQCWLREKLALHYRVLPCVLGCILDEYW